MTAALRSLALLAFTLLLAAPALAAPALRPAVTVDDSVIRLGDLFADAGAHASDVVAPAPPPGSRTLFDANWLAAAAREHKLDWQPGSPFDQAAVERATRIVTGDDVAKSLLGEISHRQSVDGARIQLDNAGFRLLVPASAPQRLDVEGLTLDPRSGRFSALVAALSPGASAQRVTGQLIRMIKLPVLSRPVAPGETIGARDIATLSFRADRVAADMVLDARELVGKTPRHLLHAEEPLRAADVQAPVIVHKGDLVTLVLETASMRLTAQAKALEDGGMGAPIRVANTKSNRIIDGTVSAPNLVTVTPVSSLTARAEVSQ